MSDVAVKLESVGKMYKIFSSRTDHLLDALALPRLVPHWKAHYREFWALRGIDLELKKGERIGIIGRNGAGKSTLLKLITRNVPITEGKIRVDGEVQALIEAGGGFHPEFTGRENIAAALLYQGHSPAKLAAAEKEIAEFTELENFLDQPFKTYSLGMQARLTFAVATSVQPNILIVDEMLGAGDAYFISKCTERMQQLVTGGATVLLVSHSLEQVMMFCEQTIWLERGRIVGRGRSMEVCKAYEKYIRELDDKRIKAKNRKLRSPSYQSVSYDNFSDTCMARFTVQAPQSASLDVSEVKLLRDGGLDDDVLVGEAQDADHGQSGHVVLDASAWSAPRLEDDRRFRTVSHKRTGSTGSVIFNLYALFAEARYEIEVTFRMSGQGGYVLELLNNGSIENVVELGDGSRRGWQTERFALRRQADANRGAGLERGIEPANGHPEASATADIATGLTVSRWPGQGSLVIDEVKLLDLLGAERAVFQVGTEMAIRMSFLARQGGDFPVIPVAVLFRRDGVLVSRYIGNPLSLPLEVGQKRVVELDLGPLRLGNGHYVFSVALYKSLDVDHRSEPEIYDLLDRSFEFEVYGTPALKTGIFLDTAQWRPIDS
jgi:lipopolysaccharide transport system ATP-binding protein